MRRERIDPNELVMSASRLARGDASEQGVSVWVELGREVPTVEVDRVQIEQVILNLFLNAFEAMSQTRRGERRLLVTTVAADADSIEVAIGILGRRHPARRGAKIFDPLHDQGGRARARPAISRRIVEAHGGRLGDAERRPWHHAPLTLPVATARLDAA
jgi:nitrogen fixation/metabolism regulation signal transduction histidine kinase